jgi:hypothetical protein
MNTTCCICLEPCTDEACTRCQTGKYMHSHCIVQMNTRQCPGCIRPLVKWSLAYIDATLLAYMNEFDRRKSSLPFYRWFPVSILANKWVLESLTTSSFVPQLAQVCTTLATNAALYNYVQEWESDHGLRCRITATLTKDTCTPLGFHMRRTSTRTFTYSYVTSAVVVTVEHEA